MKQMYTSPKVKSTSPLEQNFFKVLMIAIISICTSLTSFSQDLSFKNSVLYSGTAGQDGAVYRFAGVTPGVDALVKITGRSGSDVSLENIDITDQGLNDAFQPRLGRSGAIVSACSWWMEFEIRFVEFGTTTDVKVNNFKATALDIDGDDVTIKEFVELHNATSCTVDGQTNLVSTFLGSNNNEKDYRFTGPLSHHVNIDCQATDIMATGNYTSRSSFSVRFGAQQIGVCQSSDGVRYNSISFNSFHFTAPKTLPVKLISFNAALINKKVSLTWTTAVEKNLSHFVIERSTNGTDFTDAGVIFTDGDSETSKSYSFKDAVSTSGNGVLYYRLKMVDMDGRFERSTIRIIKLGQSSGTLQLQAFPNPVVNEVRITIPEGWQGKDVVYEVYTNGGQLVKRLQNKSATQTEVISLQTLQPGTYVIRALNDNEIAAQRIIKGR